MFALPSDSGGSVALRRSPRWAMSGVRLNGSAMAAGDGVVLRRQAPQRAEMKTSNQVFEFAIEVFVRGHSAGRSRTFP